MSPKAYAKYSLPGMVFVHHEIRELDDLDEFEALDKAPSSAFSFTMFRSDATAEELLGTTIVPSRWDEYGTFFIGGTVYSAEQLQKLSDETPGRFHSILSQCLAENWLGAIKCRDGMWQPFRKGDEILAETVPNYREISGVDDT